MASNTKMVSPGVYVSETDLSQYSAIMSTSKIIAIVGAAQNGPINTITDLESTKDFETIFGAPIDNGGLAAINCLKYSSSVKYIRAAGSTAAARTVTLAGTGAESSPVPDAIVINAKYKGTLFSDSLTATVTTVPGGTEDQFNLVITQGDSTELLNKNYSCLSSSPDFIGADTSTNFVFVVSETPLKTITAVEKSAFSAGNNGTPLDDNVLKTAIEILSDSETIDVDIIAAPGVVTGPSIAALVGVAMSRKNCVAIVDPPQGLTPQKTADFFNGTNDTHTIGKVDTTYAGAYSPWVKIYNEYSAESQMCPPSVAVLAAMANEYSTYDPWTAPAGVPRFVLNIVTEFERNLNQADRDILYAANVNPLCNYKNLGFTALGQKTMQRTLSAVDRLNVRFLVNYVKKIAEFKSANYLFMNIDDTTFESWIQDMGKELDNIKQRGGIYDYQLKMDWTTVTTEMLNNNTMPGVIQIKPTKTAEFIPIDVVIRNKDDQF